MKILIIASAARSLLNFRGHLLQALLAAGHTVIACAPGRHANVEETLETMGVTYIPIKLARGGLNPLQDGASMAALHAIFRRTRPDLALGYTIKPVIYGALAARLAGVPRYYSMITGLGYAFGDTNEPQAPWSKRRLLGMLSQTLYKLALASSQAVIFQNPDDLGLFVQLGLVPQEKTVLVNGSGVDLDHYSVEPLPAMPPVSFLLVARLIGDKGIRVYAEAAEIVKRAYPDCRFRLLGPYDSANPTAITPQEIAQWTHIDYLGATQDVRPFLAQCHVYVLPSHYREGTPRSVLEAMSCGRAIITTDSPGCRETVVNGTNGFLVPVRNPVKLAEAMTRFIEQPELIAQLGQQSRIIAQHKYDVHAVNQVLMHAMGV